ncbi:Hypothetical predicted protein [Paramuricea clavata]|uniref:Uncharacterized protein n=1 Tax=Paramuricea clavata TaxID=317549 RepID=A0A7D9I5P7_PARCT|nr:Hypothetical predicted protein [Paramuricea clavata]
MQVSDSEVKQKMARYTDVRKKRSPPWSVWVLKCCCSKNSNTNFPLVECRPYTVIARRGRSVILQQGDETPIMRNVSLVQNIPNEANSEQEYVHFSEGSTQEALFITENYGSEDGISEIGDGPMMLKLLKPQLGRLGNLDRFYI